MQPGEYHRQKIPHGVFYSLAFFASVIEFLHDLLNLTLSYIFKTTFFLKVLSDQAIGVFVQPSLPRRIRVSEIDYCIQLLCNTFVTCELFAVIALYGQHLVHIRLQQRHSSLRDNFCMLTSTFLIKVNFDTLSTMVTNAAW